MRVGDEVVCIENIPDINTYGDRVTFENKPVKNNIYIFDGFKERRNKTIGIYLVGFYEMGGSGRINFNINFFSKIPPSLEAEIAECLTIKEPELV